MNQDQIQNILLLVMTKHPDAAQAVHKLADELRALALTLEAEQNPTKSTGGMGDKVRMQVRGPNGELKQDTNPKGE